MEFLIYIFLYIIIANQLFNTKKGTTFPVEKSFYRQPRKEGW